MSRVPRGKLSRRCRSDLMLMSGVRERKYKESPPGGGSYKRPSDYGNQLQMKQIIRYYYGLKEHQFRGLYAIADRKKGATGINLLLLLECRLDNLVYRMGFASTRRDARQLIVHGHILVNGQKVDRSAFMVKASDVIEVAEKSKKSARVLFGMEAYKLREEALWLEVDHNQVKGVFNSLPSIEQLPAEFKVKLVVELYSK
jgi:small subunit ribosomal protein S4